MENTPNKSNPETVTVLSISAQRMQVFTVCVYLVSAGLILAAARGDLWLDEIWSIMFAGEATSAADIFFRFTHDNNHVMNTLFQFWIGKQNVLYVHRLLAIAAGIGSIGLVGMIAKKQGRSERLIAMLLTGTSYPLILLLSESRGYGPAVFCALLGFAALHAKPHRLNVYRIVIFWMASIAGILSHATFVIVLTALFCLSVVQESYQQADLKTLGARLGLYFLVPTSFLAGFYLFFIRHIQFGGGPVYSKWAVVCRAASLTLGFPEGPFWGTLALASVTAVTAVGGLLLYREKSAEWIFFPVVLFVSPILFIVLAQPTYLYFRYFIVCIPFFYLLLGYLIARYYRSGSKTTRWMLATFLALFVLAQAQRIVPLLQSGRGNYRAAIEYILSNSADNAVGIGSDHDFRNKVLLAFYTNLLPEPNRLFYIHQTDWKKDAPDWIITHNLDVSYRPPERLTVPDVGKYRRVKVFRSAGISGWHWFLFRRE